MGWFDAGHLHHCKQSTSPCQGGTGQAFIFLSFVGFEAIPSNAQGSLSVLAETGIWVPSPESKPARTFLKVTGTEAACRARRGKAEALPSPGQAQPK